MTDKKDNMIFLNYYGTDLEEANYAPGRFLMSIKAPTRNKDKPWISNAKKKRGSAKKNLPSIKNSKKLKPIKSMTKKMKKRMQKRSNEKFYNSYNNINESSQTENSGLSMVQQSAKRSNSKPHSRNSLNSVKNLNMLGPQESRFLNELIDKLNTSHMRLSDMIAKLMHTSVKFSEVLGGKYQVNEIDVLLNAIKESLITLKSNVEIEMELGVKTRKIGELNIRVSMLEHELKKQKEVTKNVKTDLKIKSKKNKADEEEINLLKKVCNEEKNKNLAQANQIKKLEKRLEILLESSEKIIPAEDKLRTALSEIMKENEKLKKEYQIKLREIAQLNEEKKSMQLTSTRLNKKIQSLKNRNVTGDGGEINKKDKLKVELERIKWRDKGEIMLKLNDLPVGLEFINSSLSIQYLNLLSNLNEYGPDSFAQYLTKSQRVISVKKEAISVICDQYLKFKKLSEYLNTALRKLLKLTACRDYRGLCKHLSTYFKDSLIYSEMKLWLVDEMTGIMFTFDENGKKRQIMSNKGLIGESFKLKEAAYKKKEKDRYLYRILSTGEKVNIDNTLLNPITLQGQQRPSAVLEVNFNKKEITTQDEYLILVISIYVKEMISFCYHNQCMAAEMEHKVKFMESYNRLIKAEDYYSLSQAVVSEAKELFLSRSCKFIFHENNQLIVYTSKDSGEVYHGTTGLAGTSALQKKPILVTDLSLAEIYNQRVDIYTLLPALAFPLVIKDEDDREYSIAVLEIAMKERNRSNLFDRVENIKPEAYSGNTSQFLVQLFCDMVKHVYTNMKERLGEHNTQGFNKYLNRLDTQQEEGEEGQSLDEEDIEDSSVEKSASQVIQEDRIEEEDENKETDKSIVVQKDNN